MGGRGSLRGRTAGVSGRISSLFFYLFTKLDELNLCNDYFIPRLVLLSHDLKHFGAPRQHHNDQVRTSMSQ